MKKAAATLAATTEKRLGLQTYTRSTDGATMVEIAPHSYLNAELLALAHGGRGRVTGQ